jgi:hypothetical protein
MKAPSWGDRSMEDYGLSGDQKRLLKGAIKKNGAIFRTPVDDPEDDPIVRAGSLSMTGMRAQSALDDLVKRDLVRHRREGLYVLTPEGKRIARALAATDPDP